MLTKYVDNYNQKKNIKNLLNKLNKEQTKAVLTTEGAVLIIAGAGTGKTQTMTSRAAYLIMSKKM